MSNTYTQIYIHIVFSTKGRINEITKAFNEEIHRYITGIIQKRKHKLIAINCMPDHIHIFIGLKPDVSLSDLVRDIKHSSSNFINEKNWFKGKFYWQEGYGAFSYSQSQIDNVVKYIKNQEKHHHKKTFKEEYLEFLKKFKIQYDDRYVFSE
jgi:REP element-mobilizing transposase RayT